MRRFMLFLGVLAFVTSYAMAVPVLVSIPAPLDGAHTSGSDPDYSNNTITRPLAMTSDGAYVAGQANDGSQDVGFLFNVVTGNCYDVYGGGFNDKASGVGYTDAGDIMVNGRDSGWNSVNITSNGGATWSKKRYTNIGPYSLGSFNTAAGVPSQTNSDGNGSVGTTYASMYNGADGGGLYAGGIESAGGLFKAGTPFNMKSVPGTDHYIGGISREGVAVGERDNSNYVVDVGAAHGGDKFRALGASGDTNGRAWDISDDGQWAVGNSDGGSGPRAYVKDMTTGLDDPAVELPSLAGATYSYAYGVSGAGEYACGISNSTTEGEQAILWDLTGATPVLIYLNQFATNAGIMGSFTDLFKPYSVAVNDDGYPVVSGRGMQGANEVGWVMTLPEPATLSFLALGGLALLRRRR